MEYFFCSDLWLSPTTEDLATEDPRKMFTDLQSLHRECGLQCSLRSSYVLGPSVENMASTYAKRQKTRHLGNLCHRRPVNNIVSLGVFYTDIK